MSRHRLIRALDRVIGSNPGTRTLAVGDNVRVGGGSGVVTSVRAEVGGRRLYDHVAVRLATPARVDGCRYRVGDTVYVPYDKAVPVDGNPDFDDIVDVGRARRALAKRLDAAGSDLTGASSGCPTCNAPNARFSDWCQACKDADAAREGYVVPAKRRAPARSRRVPGKALATRGGYLLKLRNAPNPDMGQYGDTGIPPAEVPVANLAEASAAAQAYIKAFDLGGGNFPHAKVYNAAGVEVARVSYNGRVWPPGPFRSDMKPLAEACPASQAPAAWLRALKQATGA